MKNSIIEFNPTTNFTSSHRKEKHFHTGYKVITFNPTTKEEFNTPLDCRIYNTPNRTYCAIWAAHKVGWFNISATSYAGGYGYDRFSSAVGHTIEAMGIKLEFSIDGVGQQAIETALMVVAKFLVNDETLFYHLVKCNG